MQLGEPYEKNKNHNFSKATTNHNNSCRNHVLPNSMQNSPTIRSKEKEEEEEEEKQSPSFRKELVK